MMDDGLKQLMSELGEVNLCTYYLLPLTGFTRASFGNGVFVNSYLDKERLWIIVQVPDLNLIPHRVRSHAIRQWSNDSGGFLAYEIDPIYWEKDVALFCEGKYSRMSDSLKAIAFDRSGLPYQEPGDDGNTYTDIRLLALEGKEAVAKHLSELLDCEIDPEQEVLSKPPVTSFMNVEEQT